MADGFIWIVMASYDRDPHPFKGFEDEEDARECAAKDPGYRRVTTVTVE